MCHSTDYCVNCHRYRHRRSPNDRMNYAISAIQPPPTSTDRSFPRHLLPAKCQFAIKTIADVWGHMPPFPPHVSSFSSRSSSPSRSWIIRRIHQIQHGHARMDLSCHALSRSPFWQIYIGKTDKKTRAKWEEMLRGRLLLERYSMVLSHRNRVGPDNCNLIKNYV